MPTGICWRFLLLLSPRANVGDVNVGEIKQKTDQITLLDHISAPFFNPHKPRIVARRLPVVLGPPLQLGAVPHL
ncbi:hypothetical protein GGR58DRAFT_492853 [Xylaria digitata]|nr:hypothetical protein GGR58DRAFT_492853 [Xylaria digitata]